MPGENLPGERIESLVDELEGIIQESKAPFGKAQQKIIETEVFFNILDEIRMSYPEEWQKSRRILRERDELLASATAQADSIIADAQQQALTIAGEQEIVRLAQQQADDIRDRAQQYERETRYAAESRCSRIWRRTSRASPPPSPVAASSSMRALTSRRTVPGSYGERNGHPARRGGSAAGAQRHRRSYRPA